MSENRERQTKNLLKNKQKLIENGEETVKKNENLEE